MKVKTTISPELKGRSRYNYYYEWQKSEGDATPSSAPISEAKVKSGEAKVKVISELEMIAEPTEEVNGEAVLGDSLAGSFGKRFAF